MKNIALLTIAKGDSKRLKNKNKFFKKINLHVNVEEGNLNLNETILSNKKLGLITPRVLMQIIFEATVAFEEGLASKEDIDSAMKYGLNHPVGPFEWQKSISAELVEALRLNMCHTISRKPNRYTR